jgi:hypothetical protein
MRGFSNEVFVHGYIHCNGIIEGNGALMPARGRSFYIKLCAEKKDNKPEVLKIVEQKASESDIH